MKQINPIYMAITLVLAVSTLKCGSSPTRIPERKLPELSQAETGKLEASKREIVRCKHAKDAQLQIENDERERLAMAESSKKALKEEADIKKKSTEIATIEKTLKVERLKSSIARLELARAIAVFEHEKSKLVAPKAPEEIKPAEYEKALKSIEKDIQSEKEDLKKLEQSFAEGK
ncbi:MAG: hypothetical protein KF713_05660 [Turneriella sp.]|nr:hypothetical protein [Turneriella sp.]